MRRVVVVAVLSLIASSCGGSAGGDTSNPLRTSTTGSSSVGTPVATFIADMGGVGDCFDTGYTADDFDYTGGATRVSCDGPHDHEVFFVGEIPAAADAPFPGNDALSDGPFLDLCQRPFEERYGVSFDLGTESLSVWGVWPLQEEWDAGLRTIKCSATTVFNFDDGTPLLGDAASAGLALPDHLVVALSNTDDGELDLFVYGLGEDGEAIESRNVTNDGAALAEQSNPSWAPDLSVIAYAAAVPGEEPDVYLVNTDGEKLRLTDHPANDGGPAISPDGTRVAFTSDRSSDDLDIFVMDIDGSNVMQLTFDDAKESSPDWSPDGSQIAYRKRVDGNDDIWVMDADGSNQHLLVGGPASEYDPDWSPDGSTIAFISDESGNFDIWTFPADGPVSIGAPSLTAAGATQITDHAATDEYPDWSPDGRFIVFASDRYGFPGVWVMRADGSDASNLLWDYPVWNPQVASS